MSRASFASLTRARTTKSDTGHRTGTAGHGSDKDHVNGGRKHQK
jgi:hypothetical protein